MLDRQTVHWLYDMILEEHVRYASIDGVIYFYYPGKIKCESAIAWEIEPYLTERKLNGV